MKTALDSVLKIRLLAIDLDDTLLTSNLTISQANRDAIRAAEEAGVRVVLASGRSPYALAPYVRQLKMDQRGGYLIAFNGSTILKSETGEEEWGVKLGAALVGEIWDLAHQVGSTLQTYRPNEILYSAPNKYTELDHQVTNTPIRQVDRAEFSSEDRVKINLTGDPDFLEAIEPEFHRVFKGRANMFRTKPFYFELMHPSADKGLALHKLADMHGIQKNEVMAIGDAMNDAGMLRWAGVSVAMANALPAVKALSSWTTRQTNDHDGVAEAIHHFILGEKI